MTRKELPPVTVEFASNEADDEIFNLKNWTPAIVGGMLCNPVYAGVGAPALIEPQKWIASAKNRIDEEGPEQFLVNMLHVLRITFPSDPNPDLRQTKSKLNPCVTGIGAHPRTVSDADWIDGAATYMYRNGVEKFLARMLEELKLTIPNSQ